MDTIFNAFFQVVGYDLVATIMTLVVVFEILFTVFETIDML